MIEMISLIAFTLIGIGSFWVTWHLGYGRGCDEMDKAWSKFMDDERQHRLHDGGR